MRSGCPDCGVRGRRVHSRYWRTVYERPVAGRKLLIRLRVRRYFCDRARCGRRTFVEQVRGLSERHLRSSTGLKEWLRAVAIELGGRAGERLCRKLSVAVGRTRLIGLLSAPELQEWAPRVLGVDEFAFRRGRAGPWHRLGADRQAVLPRCRGGGEAVGRRGRALELR
ncbi:transposase family protein, partial [Kitasatospora cineracea]|uniref:transposase family protein n=1 Tax=Kitasatospora cineracea TaxID=88074 RepID=UPI0036AFDFFA